MQIFFLFHVYCNRFTVRPVSLSFRFLSFLDGFFGSSFGLDLHDGLLFAQGFHTVF